MRTLMLTTCCLLVASSLLGQTPPTPTNPTPTPVPPRASGMEAQLQAAQIDVLLANIRLGLIAVQMKMQANQVPQARRDLANVQAMITSAARVTDMSAYKTLADRLARDLDKAPPANRRMDVEREFGQAPIPEEARLWNATPGPGYGDPKIVDPKQPGLNGQVDAAAEQARLAKENQTNVPGSRTELTDDPAVIKQRTLDHQSLWDTGRYAPAKELIDVGRMLELDRERVHYQYALSVARDGAHRDELLHVKEATIPPPRVMNYPENWQQIKAARAPYADGKMWESAPFKDADGKTKTVAVYDVHDLLFVPIFPGPSEYNANRPSDPLRFWAKQDRLRDLYLHPPFSVFGPGYNDPIYGGPGVGGIGDGGPAGVAGNRGAIGGYTGYRVTDIIPSVYYFPYEADPMYQYRLAQKRAQLLNAVNRLMAVPQE